MLAGLMAATVLGGIAPAYAQQDNNNGAWRGRGERSGRPDGGQRGGGDQDRGQAQRPQWQGGGEARQPQAWQRNDRPAPVAQPQPQPQPQPQRQVQPQWRGDQRGPANESRWNGGQPRVVTMPRGDDRNDRNGNDRNRNDNRPAWRVDRGGNDRNDRNDRRWDNNDRRWDNNDRRGNPGWSGNNWNNGRRFDDRSRWEGQRRWDSGWRNDRRYDWSSYRARYGDRYRIGRYYAPRGWGYGYSRFNIGIYLNSLLYSNSYWIDDPYYYRLPPAYGTLRWVRYYDDALLVDIRDGYVVDVIYDFFW